MNLQENIYKRKSTRKYYMDPLDTGTLNQIEKFAKDLKPLYEDIKIEYQLASHKDIKNIMPIKAPHYLVLSSENKDGYLTNIGFMFQQMDLYLSSLGLGSCWLGMAKPTEKIDTKLEFVVILAFGKPIAPPYRVIGEFKRKSLTEISDISDKRLEAARIAPSASNSQPWYFISDGNKIHVYCINLGRIKVRLYGKMNRVDIGIALAHLYVANTFTFEYYGKLSEQVKQVDGYTYIGSFKI